MIAAKPIGGSRAVWTSSDIRTRHIGVVEQFRASPILVPNHEAPISRRETPKAPRTTDSGGRPRATPWSTCWRQRPQRTPKQTLHPTCALFRFEPHRRAGRFELARKNRKIYQPPAGRPMTRLPAPNHAVRTQATSPKVTHCRFSLQRQGYSVDDSVHSCTSVTCAEHGQKPLPWRGGGGCNEMPKHDSEHKLSVAGRSHEHTPESPETHCPSPSSP